MPRRRIEQLSCVQEYYREAIPIMGRFVRREISKDTMLEELRELAIARGVGVYVDWSAWISDGYVLPWERGGAAGARAMEGVQ